ncbi:MAG TPA: hypothetical protein VGK19_05975 [Capsulimonadaceae bacterium]|jgi:hypothetical protein
MHSTQAAPTGDAAAIPRLSCVWSVRPSRRSLKRALSVLVPLAIAAAILSIALFHSLLAGIVAATLLVVTVADQLVPITYTVNETAISVRVGPVVWLDMPWANVASVSCIPEGLKLSAFDNPATARLESKRGIRLAYRAVDAERVEDAVQRFYAKSRKSNNNA